MTRANSTVHPVQALRESALRLEAAVLECLTEPRKRSVHAVRTSTRRMEAQLELLALLPEMPLHKKQAGKAAGILKKLRKAAGEVRDLDVQRALIKTGAPKDADRDTRREAKRLRNDLKRRREKKAHQLGAILRALHAKLPKAMRDLLEALQSAESFVISETRMVKLAGDWYREHSEGVLAAARAGDAEQLHGVRKMAKLARYLAESAPHAGPWARRLAQRFEVLQEAGGQWHDWLILHKIAAHELGQAAVLPRRFAARADRELNEFQRRLEAG